MLRWLLDLDPNDFKLLFLLACLLVTLFTGLDYVAGARVLVYFNLYLNVKTFAGGGSTVILVAFSPCPALRDHYFE